MTPLENEGEDFRDYGDDEWVLEPALPVAGDPVLYVEPGAAGDMIGIESVIDIDTSEHAQRVHLIYSRPRTLDDDPPLGGTDPAGDAVPDTVDYIKSSNPDHGAGGAIGSFTTVVRRRGLPSSDALAQATADTLGARAWLRGRRIEVTCPVAWWVKPGHTVRVTAPGGTATDWWVATARHDAASATSTIGLRPFTLADYPPD